MKVLITENFGRRVFRNLFSIFTKEQEEKEKMDLKTNYEVRLEKDNGAKLEKMLEAELDSLWKMQRRRKVFAAKGNVEKAFPRLLQKCKTASLKKS